MLSVYEDIAAEVDVLNGNLSLSINGVTTSYFPIDSPPETVQTAITNAFESEEVLVQIISDDENGHHIYSVEFLNFPWNYLDKYSPYDLSAITDQITPDSSRRYLDFDWRNTPPQHEIQLLAWNHSGSIAICVLNVSSSAITNQLLFEFDLSVTNLMKSSIFTRV